jgi:O-antigen/teichoic acid export membrane protein
MSESRKTNADVGEVRGANTAFRDILSVSGARGISIVLSLVSVSIVTHLLTPKQYSILAYITVIANLIFTSTSAWTSTGLTRYGREELERKGTMRSVSWSRLVITAPLIGVAVLVIALLKLLGALPQELDWLVVIIAIATGLSAVAGDHVVSLLEANGRMRLTAVALASNRVFSMAGIGIVALLGLAHSPVAIAVVWLAVAVGLAVLLGHAVWRIALWPVLIDSAMVRRMIVFSLPLLAFAVSQYVIGAVDIVVLGIYRSSKEVGYYSLAYQGYGTLQQVATTATIVLSPLFVSLHIASRSRTIELFYRRLVPQTLLLTSMLAGIAAAFVRLVVPLVFGRAFGRAAEPLVLLLAAWVLYSAASYVAPIIVLHERSRAIGIINVAGAAINVIGDWILVGPLHAGIWAPAVATSVSLLAIAAGYFVVAGRCLEQPVVLPIPTLAPAAAGIACAVSMQGWLGTAAGVLATIVAAVAVQAVARVFALDDLDMIEKLNIPGPGKRWALAFVRLVG